MRSIPPLNWLRAFEATARHLSFSLAAKSLNVTPSAVSQQVKSLEDYLQTTLFIRSSKQLRLTETGHQYLPMVSQAFLQLETATGNIFGQTDNVVRLTCGVAFSSLFIVPRLPKFRRLYPDIEIQFHNSVWWEHHQRQTRALEVRYGDGNWSESSILLAHDTLTPMVGKQYPQLAAKRTVFSQHPLFQVSGLRHTWYEWFKIAHLAANSIEDIKPIIHSDSIIPIYLMTLQNQGIALMSRFYTDYARKNGELIQPFAETLTTHEGFYLIQPTQLSYAENVFTEWLINECQELSL